MEDTAGIKHQGDELSSPGWTPLNVDESSQRRYQSLLFFRIGFEQQTDH
jgi:hypothetical protein